jgi:exopolyphosphatase/guanosine-5'-triphosphate,3'-diphosphate pyrophosphatase
MSDNLPIKIAVIDCGTNTFALNIYESENGKDFKRIYKERYFVELLEEGRDRIGDAPYARALNAHYKFAETLLKYDITLMRVVGTAALRLASNGAQLMQEIADTTGIKIELIDGMREADLIYKGVRLATPTEEAPFLIMDIGGGSVEFILCDNDKVFWAQSFNIGAAILFDQFRPKDPVEQETIDTMQTTLTEALESLWQAAADFPRLTLVGASGTFDVIASMHTPSRKRHAKRYEIIGADFFLQQVYQKLISSTYDQRIAMHDLPPTRAKLIVGVIILIRLVIQRLNIQNLAVSDYALREGCAWELLHPTNS